VRANVCSPGELDPVPSYESAAKLKNSVVPSTLVRLLKFNFVGAIGILVQFAVLFVLKSVLHIHYLLATVIAVEAAVVHNFVWHEQFTWADRTKEERTRQHRINEAQANEDRTKKDPMGPDRFLPTWRRSLLRLLRFNLANGAVSILGNVSLMRVMVGEGHINYLAANGIAIALCSVANFVVSETWVFERQAG
jgi:putative flippase GtrA